MSQDFDPYHLWLGIPREEQPANLYRLLGAPLFEAKAEVIESAADRQMLHLKTFQTGKHAAQSQRLMNEVTTSRSKRTGRFRLACPMRRPATSFSTPTPPRR